MIAACGPSVDSRADVPAPCRSPSLAADAVVRDELVGSGASSVLEALQRTRPRFLRTRSPRAPVLYIDGMPAGPIASLDAIPVNSVRYVVHLSAPEATIRYGTGHSGGAILVMMRDGTGSASCPI